MRPSARPGTSRPPRAARFGPLLRFRLRFSELAAALLLIALVGIAHADALDVRVLSVDGRPLRGAVIQVRSLDAPAHHAAPQHAVMDQVDRAFAPDLLIIPVGSTIVFPNSDSVSHQIYSFSPAKRFQLPLYHGKPYPPVEFDQTGVVTLGCNIHDQMLAYVVVTDALYFGRTDANGAWSSEIAAGRYRVAVWHPRLREDAAALERDVTAEQNGPAEITVRLSKPLQPAPRTDKPYSWEY